MGKFVSLFSENLYAQKGIIWDSGILSNFFEKSFLKNDVALMDVGWGGFVRWVRTRLGGPFFTLFLELFFLNFYFFFRYFCLDLFFRIFFIPELPPPLSAPPLPLSLIYNWRYVNTLRLRRSLSVPFLLKWYELFLYFQKLECLLVLWRTNFHLNLTWQMRIVFSLLLAELGSSWPPDTNESCARFP